MAKTAAKPTTGKGLTAAPPKGAASAPMKWIQIGKQTWKDATGKRVTSDVDPNVTGAPMWKGQALAGYTPTNPPVAAGPATPDPTAKIYTPEEVAKAQSEWNTKTAQQQADINRINEVNPYGSSTYTKNADGTVTRNVNLSPAEQAKLDWQNSADTRVSGLIDNSLNQVADAWKNPLSFDDLGKMPGVGDNEAIRAKMEKDLVDRYTRDMQPQWDQQQQQFIQEMAQRGIPEGSEQFNKQMAAFQKQRDQGLMDITSQAIQGAGAEDTRLFNQNLASRQQMVGERTTQRAQPFSEASALMGARQGVTNPQFAPTPDVTVAPTDFTGAYQTYQTNQQKRADSAQQQQQFQSAQDFQAQQAALDRANQGKIASRYGPQPDNWQAKADLNFQHQMALNQQQFQNAQSLQNGNKPTTSSQIGSALGGIAGAFAGGFGQSLGQNLFGKRDTSPTASGATQRGIGGAAAQISGYDRQGNPIYGSGNGQGFMGQPPINYTAAYNPILNKKYSQYGN